MHFVPIFCTWFFESCCRNTCTFSIHTNTHSVFFPLAFAFRRNFIFSVHHNSLTEPILNSILFAMMWMALLFFYFMLLLFCTPWCKIMKVHCAFSMAQCIGKNEFTYHIPFASFSLMVSQRNRHRRRCCRRCLRHHRHSHDYWMEMKVEKCEQKAFHSINASSRFLFDFLFFFALHFCRLYFIRCTLFGLLKCSLNWFRFG